MANLPNLEKNPAERNKMRIRNSDTGRKLDATHVFDSILYDEQGLSFSALKSLRFSKFVNRFQDSLNKNLLLLLDVDSRAQKF